MKRTLLGVALAVSAFIPHLASGSAQQDEALLAAVPESSEMIFSLDVARVIDLPLVNELRKNDPEASKQFTELEAKLAKHGLKLKDFASSIMVFAKEDGFGGGIVSTKIGEQKLESFLKGEIIGTPSQFSVENIQGRKVFILSGAEKSLIPDPALAAALTAGIDSDPAQQKSVALTFIAPEQLLFMEKSNLDAYFAAKKGAPQSLLKRKEPLESGSLFWGVMKLPKTADANSADASQNPLLPLTPAASKVSGAAFALNFTGQTSEDISIKLSLDCVDKAAAAAQSMQIQQMIWALSMASQASDPQTGMQLMNAVKVNTKENNILLDIFLPKTLIEKLKGMAQSQFGAQIGGGAPMDADADPFGAPQKRPGAKSTTTAPSN